MEVCGGHTVAIRKFGIPGLLPSTIQLLSGPGCPICVTGRSFIDKTIQLANTTNTIVATFGDLIRVPGTSSSLDRERASGADIRMIYSPLDALQIARENLSKQIVFPAIGFETTAPSSAVTILQAKKEKLSNFFILNAHKIMPPAMEAIIDDQVQIDGYICPGHVSTITGPEIYESIVDKFGLGCVITGFEPVDLLQGILMLVKQFEAKDPKVEIQYKRAVKSEGNKKAMQLLNEVFEPRDDEWRGLGMIPKSGLKLKKEFCEFDADLQFNFNPTIIEKESSCICGKILKGLKLPNDCKLFGEKCSPDNPVGACMVSPEGSCQAFYNYEV